MTTLNTSPMAPYYEKNGIKLVDFEGWALPMQFSRIMEEHEAVRTAVGYFDCSHMGEIEVAGADAEQFLNLLVTNDVTKLKDGRAQYAILCNTNGGAIDDILVYRRNATTFMIVCNASNTTKVWNWLDGQALGEVHLTNRTKEYGLIAVQGPKAQELLQSMTEESLERMKKNDFIEGVLIGTQTVSILSRTGYTGEDGFELYVPYDTTHMLWEELVQKGEALCGKPCGLGARDTLRLEACYPLYGHELSEDISPLMAGVGFAVKTKKKTFVGKQALLEQRTNGVPKKVVAIKLLERGIPRQGYPVQNMEGKEIGTFTSGTQSPSLGVGIGLALVDAAESVIGTKVSVLVRNKAIPAEIVNKPFYPEEDAQ